MATIIDSLLVTLGLDTKKFNAERERVNKGLKDTGQEAGRTGEKLNKAGKDGAEGFKQSADGLSKLMALMAAGYVIKNFVVNMVNTNSEIYRFSRNLQQSARDISAWGNAVEITGGDAKAFRGTLSMLSKAQTEIMMTGQSGLIPFFSRFGVAMFDASGGARKQTDMLLDLADAMKGMDRTTAYNVLQSMGIDEGTANAMLEGRKGLQALIDKQKEHNALTDKQALNAENTRRSMKEAELAVQATKNELADGLNPAVKTLLDLFNQLDVATSGWSTALFGLAASIAASATALAGLKTVLGIGGGAAAGGGTAAAAGGGWLARAFGFLKGGLGIAALTYSGGLNTNEDAELAKRRGMGPTITGGGGGDKQARLASLERQYGLPAGVLDKVWAAESGRGRNMNSAAGAQGHFQFMPGTAKQYGLDNPYDFDQSAAAAAKYLSDLRRQFGGDMSKAIAAYNWGPGNVKRKGLGAAPKETRDYHAKIMGTALPGAAMTASGGNSTSVNVGSVVINTQATDAASIARDFRAALNTQYQNQANVGLN